MRELVPLTNAVAARMITSVLSGRGGGHALLSHAHARTSVLTAAKAASEAATVNAQAAPKVKSAAEAKAASPANDRSREHHSPRWLPAAV